MENINYDKVLVVMQYIYHIYSFYILDNSSVYILY